MTQKNVFSVTKILEGWEKRKTDLRTFIHSQLSKNKEENAKLITERLNYIQWISEQQLNEFIKSSKLKKTVLYLHQDTKQIVAETNSTHMGERQIRQKWNEFIKRKTGKEVPSSEYTELCFKWDAFELAMNATEYWLKSLTSENVENIPELHENLIFGRSSAATNTWFYTKKVLISQ